LASCALATLLENVAKLKHVDRNFLQPSHTFEKEVQMYSLVFLDMARLAYTLVKIYRVDS
jgi:hypothetical protein